MMTRRPVKVPIRRTCGSPIASVLSARDIVERPRKAEVISPSLFDILHEGLIEVEAAIPADPGHLLLRRAKPTRWIRRRRFGGNSPMGTHFIVLPALGIVSALRSSGSS